LFQENEAMQVGVILYGAARVVIGQPRVEVTCDTPTIALGQVMEQLIAAYPRARPYLLDESGMLPSHIRVLINEVRPDPDATLATVLHDGDWIALLVAGGEKAFPPSRLAEHLIVD
jgi:molybdopterin converting factor small subunit